MEKANHDPQSAQQKHIQRAQATSESAPSELSRSAQFDFAPERLSPTQVIMLQRRFGNHTTRNILQRNPIQRDTSAAVTLDDDEDSESYSESEEDERDVPMAYDAEEEDEAIDVPDNETLRKEMGDLKYFGLADKYGWAPVNALCDYLVDILIEDGEAALADYEMSVIKHRVITKHLHYDKKDQIMEASPTIAAIIEEGKAADRMSDYDHVMDLLRTDHMSKVQSQYLVLAKRYYYNPPEDFPYTDELRSLVETDTWSWLLNDDMQTKEDAIRLFTARDQLKESQQAADSTSIDPIEATTGGTVKTVAGISQAITVTEGVDILSQIDSDTQGQGHGYTGP
jgi:hypothetical protein